MQNLKTETIELLKENGKYDGSEWWEFKSLPSRPPVADADSDFSRLVFSESFFW